MSIQSSGLGNMLNALMSLSRVYDLPLPILASWRGVYHEAICAQVPFNEPLPRVLDVYGIPYRIFSTGEDLIHLDEVIAGAYANRTPYVALIKPSCWEPQEPVEIVYPPRESPARILSLPGYGKPTMKRLDAVRVVAEYADADTVIVSNIGVPSKELYASKDREGNFYMLGSYMQASAIGLGCALALPHKRVIVIDGDGSLLGSAVLPVVAAAGCSNLTIAALDNGTFGSTGNQMSPAYATADLGFLALGAGIASVERVCSADAQLSVCVLQMNCERLLIGERSLSMYFSLPETRRRRTFRCHRRRSVIGLCSSAKCDSVGYLENSFFLFV